MKIKFDSDGNLPLNKTREITVVVIRALLYENMIQQFF